MAQVAGFAQIRLDISDFPTRHPYGLALWQNHIERILADWVGELGVPIYRGHRIATCTQDDTGVDVVASDGRTLRGQYLVGCDGGRSVIRKAAGIDFPGWEATTSYLLAEAEMDWRTGQSPQWGFTTIRSACMPCPRRSRPGVCGCWSPSGSCAARPSRT